VLGQFEHSSRFSPGACGIMVAVAKDPEVKVKILVVPIGKKLKKIPIRIIPLQTVPIPKDSKK
jgi:hypothetical protein